MEEQIALESIVLERVRAAPEMSPSCKHQAGGADEYHHGRRDYWEGILHHSSEEAALALDRAAQVNSEANVLLADLVATTTKKLASTVIEEPEPAKSEELKHGMAFWMQSKRLLENLEFYERVGASMWLPPSEDGK